MTGLPAVQDRTPLDRRPKHDVVPGRPAALDVEHRAAAGIDTVAHHDDVSRVHEVGRMLDGAEWMRAVARGGVVADVRVHVERSRLRWRRGPPARNQSDDEAEQECDGLHRSTSGRVVRSTYCRYSCGKARRAAPLSRRTSKALRQPRNAANSPIRAAGVQALGMNRPRIQHSPTDSGRSTGSDVKRYARPAAAAERTTSGELSPPGTEAVRHGAPSSWAGLSRLTG